jgi:hypothetical protein
MATTYRVRLILEARTNHLDAWAPLGAHDLTGPTSEAIAQAVVTTLTQEDLMAMDGIAEVVMAEWRTTPS